MQMIKYSEVLTGADADVLNGSELETAPGHGTYVIRAASTVNTATLAVSSPGRAAVSQARAIVLRANGEILSQDTPWVQPVQPGLRVQIALAGTTGTVYVEVAFMGAV